MSWADIEDRANRVVADTFGVSATYEPAIGEPFGPAFAIQLVVGSPNSIEGLEAAYLHAWAPAADFASGPAQGDHVEMDGKRYVIAGVHADGAGVWLSLNLE